MRAHETIEDDDQTLALRALVWTLGDEARADRLLSLTGITPDDLRTRLNDSTLHDALIGFLEAHQPDLIACAQALGIPPERLIAARERLSA